MTSWTLLLLAVAACSPKTDTAPEAAAAFVPPSGLTASLTDPDNVDLRWTNNGGELGASFLEFNMNPGEDFTLLEVLPPDATTIRHPDVAPGTTFSYRVRPVFGRVSEVAEVTTGVSAPGTPELEEEGPLQPLPDATVPPRAAQRSLRAPSTLPDARPAALSAALSSPTSIDLRWTDRALDEEGYLVEMSLHPDPSFKVCALLPADAVSFRKARLPAGTKTRFRVRAYVLGPASNVVTVTTPERSSP
jgi:hypothetical protein